MEKYEGVKDGAKSILEASTVSKQINQTVSW